MTFDESLKIKKSHVDTCLQGLFESSRNKYERHIQEAMRYSLLVGGKRLRPILLIEMGQAFGLSTDDVMDFGCALEMIHTYSLVHDDLPSMDDDDLRRNKPTNHKVYGEGMAILAGDGLLTAAFDLMTQKCLQGHKGHLKAMAVVSSAAGHQGMIGGQVADLQCEDQAAGKEDLHYIHTHKTGQLLAAPLLVAGCIAGVDDQVLEDLRAIGLKMGLIFQITDDLLDIEGDQDKLGKPIGSDAKNHKMTYPAFYGREASREKITDLMEEVTLLLDSLPVTCNFLKDFLFYLKNRQY